MEKANPSERMTVKEIQEATGVSAATIYRELKKSKTSSFALFVFILYIMDF